MILRPEFIEPEKQVNQFIGDYKPSLTRLFSDSMAYGFRTMWWQEKFDELEFDNAAKGKTLLEDHSKGRIPLTVLNGLKE